jgi:hypothetical protein
VAASRGDLDLGDLLGADVTHYRDVLEGKAPPRTTLPATAGLVVERFSPELPDLASSCTALAPDPEVCWDVCGYYLLLGVSWKATRRELLDAYTARGGPDSERLTYVLKQLLREGGQLRRRYDRAPLGELFREDRDVETYLLRLAIKVAGQRGVSQEDVLQGWGLAYQKRVRADEGLEGPQERGIRFDADAQAGASDPAIASAWWAEEWGWYGLNLWQVPPRAGEILAEWQRLLVAEFSGRGVLVRFAVGLGPVTEGVSSQNLHIGPNGSAIFFIHTEQPSPQMATEAAEGYRTALTPPQTGEPSDA